MEFTASTRQSTIEAIKSNIDSMEDIKSYHYVRGLIDMAWALGVLSETQRLVLSNESERMMKEICTEDDLN